jgi:hypothetical protein
MKPITPHLWFDKEAKETAQFYCSVFPNSKITSVRTALNVSMAIGISVLPAADANEQNAQWQRAGVRDVAEDRPGSNVRHLAAAF